MTIDERLDVLETENRALRELLLKHLSRINAKLFPADENPPAVDFASIYTRTPKGPKAPAQETDARIAGLAGIYKR